ncbi:hypothetical protein HPB49_004005 [Dermacentor silvarum]|uniref:Uncharacterized protein n=1 Tax=Dermacentor silvarum TaxID=543639 RepID=A0ACB8CV74_DERSI|nr:hypothetical protein HPB49_004005 [Dermacentor silvarum]
MEIPVEEYDDTSQWISVIQAQKMSNCRRKSHSNQEMLRDLQQRNKGKDFEIAGARRLGQTKSVLIIFVNTTRVPESIDLFGGVVRCYYFKPKIEACFNCRIPGHRVDVCPQEKQELCYRCGQSHPKKENPDCTRKCIVCKGDHVTGTRRCKFRYEKQRKPATSPAPPKKNDGCLKKPVHFSHTRPWNEKSKQVKLLPALVQKHLQRPVKTVRRRHARALALTAVVTWRAVAYEGRGRTVEPTPYVRVQGCRRPSKWRPLQLSGARTSSLARGFALAPLARVVPGLWSPPGDLCSPHGGSGTATGTPTGTGTPAAAGKAGITEPYARQISPRTAGAVLVLSRLSGSGLDPDDTDLDTSDPCTPVSERSLLRASQSLLLSARSSYHSLCCRVHH